MLQTVFGGKRWLLMLLLVLAAFGTYKDSLHNAFAIWDDDTLVYENPLTQRITLENVAGAFTSYDPELYVPATIVSFQIEHALFGFNAFNFHLDNLLLHIIAACLGMLLLERLGLRQGTAFFAALLFTVHPLNTEAVAWVSARKDLFAGVFSLSSALAYLSYRDGNRRFLWISIGFFVLALLSKPVSIVLPFALLLLDWKETGKIRRADWTGKIPFFALSAIFLIIGIYGKQRNLAALSLLETLLLAVKSTVFSLEKFFLPTALSPIYLQTNPISITQSEFLVPVGIVITALAIIFLIPKKGGKCSAPVKAIMFASMWYAVFLVPSFANFDKDHSVYFFSDRYIYLSQIGIFFLLGFAIDTYVLTDHGKVRRAALMLMTAGIAGLFSWGAHAQSLLWKDSETLYRDSLRKNDRSVIMHYNLGLLEQKRGNRDAAFAEYQKVLSLDPDDWKTLTNLGMWYNEEGDRTKAMEYLQRAADIAPTSPLVHSNIGVVLMDQGDTDGAIAAFRKAIVASERFAQAHINLAAALGRKELYEEALREYKRAYELVPELLNDLPDVRRALESF